MDGTSEGFIVLLSRSMDALIECVSLRDDARTDNIDMAFSISIPLFILDAFVRFPVHYTPIVSAPQRSTAPQV